MTERENISANNNNVNSNPYNKAPKDEHIKVFLRVRPNNLNPDFMNYKDESSIELHVDKTQKMLKDYVNNSKENYNFKFDKVFNQQTSQSKIFEDIAKEVCDSALDGYNGTIFAYGQTGSGKTYTITGGVERVEDRGIIPRALNYIFHEAKNRTNMKYTVRVSYLEIYNNEGFDLLDKASGAQRLEDLPKVIMRENADKQLLLYNLSFHQVNDENDALLLLMIGDDNRVVAETPKNDASTRSHCIFMIHIEGVSDEIDENGEINQIRTLAKLHIVDLSGSEKATKTDLHGVRFDEAKNINLSLHFLGQVISSINKKQHHVPYRNTMMTMVLRDSLGGNCKTRMIATVSGLREDVWESISTCYFAKSVALVKNAVVKNEIEDPEVVIKKQRGEIEELKNELKLIKGVDQKDILEEEDKELCLKLVNNFLTSDANEHRIKLKDFLMIQECYDIMKMKIKGLEKKCNEGSNDLATSGVVVCGKCKDKEIEYESRIDKLKSELNNAKEIVKKKDDELKSLLNYMEKMNMNTQRSNYNDNNTLLDKISKEEQINLSKVNNLKDNYLGEEIKFKADSNSNTNISNIGSNLNSTNNDNNVLKQANQVKQIPLGLLTEINKVNSMLKQQSIQKQKEELTKEIIQNTKLAYDYFKRNYIKSSIHENNLAKLKSLFEQGKENAEQHQKLREKISSLKIKLEEIRKEFKVMNYDEFNRPPLELRNLEDNIITELTKAKEEFDVNCKYLQKGKSEVEFLQHTIEDNTTKTAKDFDHWHSVMIKKFEYELKNKINLMNDFSLKLNSNSNNNNNNLSNINTSLSTNTNVNSNINNINNKGNYLSNNMNNSLFTNNKNLNNNILNSSSMLNASINKTNNSVLGSSSNKALNDTMSLLAQAKGIINKSNTNNISNNN